MAIDESSLIGLQDANDGAGTAGAPSPGTGQPDASAGAAAGATPAGSSPDDERVPIGRLKEVQAQVDRYRSLGLDGLADELERDPTKIHDIRAALAGGYRPAAPAPQPQPQAPSADPAAMREQFRQLQEQDPLQASLLAGQAAAQAVLQQAIEPIRQIAYQQSVESFKGRMRGQIPQQYWRATEGIFDNLASKKNFTGLNAQQLNLALGEVFFTAFGIAQAQALQKGIASGKIRTGEPPMMGTGAAPMGGAPQAPSADPDMLKAAREVAKWGGLDEKEADALLR